MITYCDWKLEAEKLCFTGGMRDCCSPKLYPGDQARLWRNRGDGTFEDVTAEAGLLAGRGLGLVSVDLNDDGWMDVFVANDVMENVLYLGGPQLPLVRAGLMAGVSYSPTGQAEGSMGADAGDFDGNGKPDLIYANYAREDNSLLKCIGPGEFANVSDISGVSGQTASGSRSEPASRTSTGMAGRICSSATVTWSTRGIRAVLPARPVIPESGRRAIHRRERPGRALFQHPSRRTRGHRGRSGR